MSAMRHEMTLLITTDSLIDGTFVVDDTHRIVSWNEAATHALGFDADATLGRTCGEMFALLHTEDVAICPDADFESSADHPQWVERHERLQRRNPPVRLRVIGQDGDPRWLSVSVVRAMTLDGVPCFVHVFRDVTSSEVHPEEEPIEMLGSSPSHANRRMPSFYTGNGAGGDNQHTMETTPEHLTPREREVLHLLARGMATIDIASSLGISRVTARNHVTRVIEKLGVRTRLQAVLAASHLGLI
ncbi:MAG TPA: LuxR C-terminal-related transcriptional regulator [Ktedonobacterales bacterium]|nr:LuxR C-terminal-related transcriptional regulator [Ktedonobacterales bacterium]